MPDATDVGTRYLAALSDVRQAELDLAIIQAGLNKQRELETEAFGRKSKARSALRALELEVLESLASDG